MEEGTGELGHVGQCREVKPTVWITCECCPPWLSQGVPPSLLKVQIPVPHPRSGSESLEGRTFGRRPKLLFLKRSLLVVRINKFGKPHYGPYMSSESETMRSNVDLISF